MPPSSASPAALPEPMETGDALFFSNYTWHRSEPNRTGETMMFYGIAYQLQKEAAAAS